MAFAHDLINKAMMVYKVEKMFRLVISTVRQLEISLNAECHKVIQ